MTPERFATRKRTTIHDLLEEARRLYRRVTALEAFEAMRDGAVLVDTRSEDQRRREGIIPGALHHPLSVLEWRLDPESGHNDPVIGLGARVMLICAEGYSSSLAAARLMQLGFEHVTDVIDGVEGWKAAGLPLLLQGPFT